MQTYNTPNNNYDIHIPNIKNIICYTNETFIVINIVYYFDRNQNDNYCVLTAYRSNIMNYNTYVYNQVSLRFYNKYIVILKHIFIVPHTVNGVFFFS